MKFKNYIEVQSGVKDNNASSGTPGQILSSTQTGVEWINQDAISSSSNFVYFSVKNETGTTIPRGAGVMAVGTDGNSGHILIDEFIADGSVEPKYFLGLMEDSIANGAFGRAVSFGEIDQINTNAFSDGDVLWTDPAVPGGLTTTEPDGPNTKLAVAIVLNSSTNGKVFCRVQGNEGVNDLHDTKIVNQVDGDVLVWDNTTGVWFNDSTLNVDYTNGRVGIGTTSPNYPLEVVGKSASSDGFHKTGSQGVILSAGSGADTAVISNGWTSGVGDWMRLEVPSADDEGGIIQLNSNGNVGIGTTSPVVELDVQGSIFTSGGLYFTPNGSTSSVPTWGMLLNAAGDLVIDDTTGPQNVIFSNSGNVGIGTTSPNQKLHVNGGTQLGDFNATTNFGTVALKVVEGTVATGPTLGSGTVGAQAVLYSNGQFGMYTGVSNNGDTWMQSQRNDTGTSTYNILLNPAGGNVGIGTTSPSAKLSVKSSGTNNWVFRATASDGGDLGGIYEDGGTNAELYIKNSAGTSSVLINSSGDSYFNGGNVGIGTTSPTTNYSKVLQINAAGNGSTLRLTDVGSGSAVGSGLELLQYGVDSYIINRENGVMRFWNNSSSKMVILANGNVGIGTTSPSQNLHVVGISGATTGLQIINSYGSPTINAYYNSFTTSASLYVGTPFSGLSCNASAFNITSDYRLKENIIELTGAISKIKNLRPVRFNYKNKEETINGFIAHEVQDVVPEAVTGEKDALYEDGKEKYQGLDNGKLVPLLTAALQQAIGKIEELELRIQTLENK